MQTNMHKYTHKSRIYAEYMHNMHESKQINNVMAYFAQICTPHFADDGWPIQMCLS